MIRMLLYSYTINKTDLLLLLLRNIGVCIVLGGLSLWAIERVYTLLIRGNENSRSLVISLYILKMIVVMLLVFILTELLSFTAVWMSFLIVVFFALITIQVCIHLSWFLPFLPKSWLGKRAKSTVSISDLVEGDTSDEATGQLCDLIGAILDPMPVMEVKFIHIKYLRENVFRLIVRVECFSDDRADVYISLVKNVYEIIYNNGYSIIAVNSTETIE